MKNAQKRFNIRQNYISKKVRKKANITDLYVLLYHKKLRVYDSMHKIYW